MSGRGGPSDAGLSELLDPVFLAELRLQMMKFATQQLGDSSLADDAVQEALTGALRNQRSFGNRSAVKTWVFGILKYKIIDLLRQSSRTVAVSELVAQEDEAEAFDQLFTGRGGWQAQARPSRWAEPEAAAQDADFWEVFETCLENLPGQQGRVFMMREFVDMESQEICDTLGISLNNLNVLLYRARCRLRQCLERGWFAEEALS